MGCGTSQRRKDTNHIDQIRKPNTSKNEKGQLKLSCCGVELSSQQVTRAQHKFMRILEQASETDKSMEKQALRLENVVERLVQRLICSIGHLDSRFQSKFLINNNPVHTKNDDGSRLRFRYMVRLDALSTPGIYLEEPPVRILQGTGRDSLPAGFARIRVHGDYLELWSDLINHHGYLRRDKVQERFMELLAAAAGQPGKPSSPMEVDDSRYCGAPGKVIDPLTLHHILQLSPKCQCFCGAAESDEARFPDPRDFRIAIIEGVPEVRLHIAFLSPAAHTLTAEEDAEIVLTVCIGVNDWPQESDFPARLPLDHCDILLALKASQTGYVLVPCGPHHTIRCEDRTAIWEIRTPAALTMLQYHYSSSSVVVRCSKLLLIFMDTLRSRGMKTINSFILQSLLWWELEKRPRLDDWIPSLISLRVISILDTLAFCLRHQHLRSYIFPSVNLLLQPCVAEEDYKSDADILEAYLTQFQYDRGDFDLLKCETSVQDHLETAMLHKWNNIINNLTKSQTEKRLSLNNKGNSVRYSRRQMEYIAVLLREILKLRQIQQAYRIPMSYTSVSSSGSLDEFFYLLQSVFEQAKGRAWNERNSEDKRRARDIMDTYDVSTALLIDSLKRDETLSKNFSSDMQLVAKVIECVHAAADSDKKVLGPILKPYLNQLNKGSRENCWFLPEWLKRIDSSEFEAIGAFSNLVLTEHLDPLQGLLDCVSKGWNWAKHALYMLKAASDENSAEILLGKRMDSPSSGLKLLFTPVLNQTIIQNLLLTDAQSLEVSEYLEEDHGRTPLSTLRRGKKVDNRYATVRSFPDTLYTENGDFTNKKYDTWCKLRAWSDKQPPHGQLRDSSPLTVISMATRRQGTHRGLGSIVQALISLNKLTALQEISIYLPEDERSRVLGDIQKLSKEVQRMSINRRRSDGAAGKTRFSFRKLSKKHKIDKSDDIKSRTLPHTMRRKKSVPEPSKEVYKSRNEFLEDVKKKEDMSTQSKFEKRFSKMNDESLLGTCRMLTIQNRIAVDKIDYNTGRYGNFGQRNLEFDSSIMFLQTPPKIQASYVKVNHQPEMTEI